MIHQRHRQTDGQTTCDSRTALCTVVHRAVKTSLQTWPLRMSTDNCSNVRIKSSARNDPTDLHTSWKTSTLLTHSCSNDGVIQLGPLGSDAMFEIVEISDAGIVHLLLQDAPHAVVFQPVWRWLVIISSTAFNSDIQTIVGWYSGPIFLQLSVMTLCIPIHDDRLIHKEK